MRAPSRAFPTFLHAAVHVLVGRFSRTPHLGWVAAMYPLCGHALLGFVASSSESGAAAFAHGTFSCCPHNFQHATFHALPTSATLARAPACCALCPHIQCACVGTALCCLASTAVRCQCTLYKHHGPVQFGAQCCSTVCLITCPCSPLLASTNHSFGSPGIRLRVDDHSVEMRSRGCCF